MKPECAAGGGKTASLDVIPCPRKHSCIGGEPKRFSRKTPLKAVLLSGGETSRYAAGTLEKALGETAGLSFLIHEADNSSISSAGFKDILLCGRRNDKVESLLPGRTRESMALRDPQGYVIHSAAGSPVIVYSRTETGLLYAVHTLRQLFSKQAGGAVLVNIHIEDYPEFKIRGNNWNLFAEIGGHSYDRGDGPAEYERRVIKKLDLCAAYKINAVYFDGVGWNPERFPGYGAMMRRINRAARVRRVVAGFAGYGSGYGPPELHVSPVFMNRKKYPAGETYACCGSGRSGMMGTCLSNRGLLRRKQDNLVEFVKAVEPGLLYIHNLDVSTISDSEKAWKLRCGECRKLWPSDSIYSPRGMAGAYADFYNRIAEAVNSVENQASNYKAGRDAILQMVSPNYGRRSESDADWEGHLKYFKTIASRIKHPNISVVIREQFYNRGNSRRRCLQMSEVFKKSKGMLAIIHFFGGDFFYNNTPFLPVPAGSGILKGADGLFFGNGNAYQEPQQVFNAECLWNAGRSPFFKVNHPRSFNAYLKWYGDLKSGKIRPDDIFSPGGFLDRICAELYGKAAGKHIAGIYRMQGKTRLDGLLRHYAFTAPLLPIWNKLMPILPFSDFMLDGLEWKKDLTEQQFNKLNLLLKVYRGIGKLQELSVKLAEKAAASPGSKHGAKEDIDWLLTTLRDGSVLSDFMREYLDIFLQIHPGLGKPVKNSAVMRQLDMLGMKLNESKEDFNRRYPGKPIGPFGGDPEYRKKVVFWLAEETSKMGRTISEGVWPAGNRLLQWW